MRDDPKNPPEVMVLRGTLSEGLHRLEAVKDAESTVAKISDKARALLVDKEQADPKPAMLGAIHESLNGIGLADGSTLVLGRRVHFSSTGYKAELELDRNWEFSYLPAGAAPGSERTPCTTLMGGTLEETGSRPSFRSSPQGDVVLVHTEGASQVWKLDHGQGKPACNFVALGKIGVPLTRGEDPGEPHRSGLVARSRFDGEDSVVYVAKPGEELPTELVRSPSIALRPAGLDRRRVAGDRWLRVRRADRRRVYLMSPAHPDHALRLDAMALDASTGIHQIAPAPERPERPAPARHRLQRPRPAAVPRRCTEAVERPVHRGARRRQDAAGPVGGRRHRATHPQPRQRRLHCHRADERGLGLRHAGRAGRQRRGVPDPRHRQRRRRCRQPPRDRSGLAIEAAGGPPALRLLTRNGLEDHTPMFTADSKTVVFRTRFPFEKTNWTLTTARSVPVRK